MIWFIYNSDEFDGWCTANHLEPRRIGLRQAINLAWHFLTKEGDKKSIEKLKAELLRPLPGQSQNVSDELVAGEMTMFAKAMNGQTKRQDK